MTAMVLLGAISPWFIGGGVVVVFALVGAPLLLGAVRIQERQVGVVVKRFGARELPPAKLMETQTDQKIAEEQRKTYEVQEAAQIQRQQLVRQTSLADIQHQVVGAEQGVQIAELTANAHIKQVTGQAEATRLEALGEAEAIRATGDAKAQAYRAGVESLGAQGYTLMQLMQIVGERNVRIVPDVNVIGASANSGMIDGMLGLMLRQQTQTKPATV